MKYDSYGHEYAQEQIKSKLLDRELILRLFGYLKPYRLLLFFGVILILASKAIEAIVPILLGTLSQKILDSVSIHEAQKEEILSYVLKNGFFIFSLLIISYLFDSLNVVIKNWIGQKGLFKLRMQTYEHTLKMPLTYYDNNSIGRLMTRTIHDIDQINQMFAESVIPIMGNLILFLCIFFGILYINWHIALMVIVLLPFVWWITHRFRYYQRRCYDRIRTVVSAMNTYIQEQLMGASTVRNFGLQKPAREAFEAINADHCDAYIDSINHFGFFMASIDFLQNCTLIFAFVVIISFTQVGIGFEAGTYFTFSLYAIMFFRPLADLAERYNVLQAAMSAAARVFHLLDQPSERTKDLGTYNLDRIDSISFEDVWFAYEQDNWILKGVSFTIKKGESCALVGITGEGKSTILSLLLRFYDIQKGTIKINGLDIRNYTLDALRSQFSLVLQDPIIFSGTIAENISLFNPDINTAEVQKIAHELGLEQLLSRFKQGIHTYLHERGQGLSTGEMQLISVARAMAHQRTILILDEATANIDSATEQIIQQALKKLIKHATALIVAHRLSTIKDVDRIFVLKEGKIIEEGSHADLLATHGIYEKLYRLQWT